MKKIIFGVVLAGALIIPAVLVYAEEQSEHQMMQMPMGKQKQPDIVTSEKAVNVENKICPVSGDKIEESTKATYEYKGKIYNFCCASCIEEFKTNPEKYIKKIEEQEKSESKSIEKHDMKNM